MESEEVESKEFEKDVDRKGPRRQEMSIAKLKDEFREMGATINTLIQQNQMLVEIVQKKKLVVGRIQTDLYEECSEANNMGHETLKLPRGVRDVLRCVGVQWRRSEGDKLWVVPK